MKAKANGDRKIQVLVGLTRTQMRWLDKQKTRLKLKSRSHVIRYIITQSIDKLC